MKPASKNQNNLLATIKFNIKLTFESRKQQSKGILCGEGEHFRFVFFKNGKTNKKLNGLAASLPILRTKNAANLTASRTN